MNRACSVTNSYVSPRWGLNGFFDLCLQILNCDKLCAAVSANLLKPSGSWAARATSSSSTFTLSAALWSMLKGSDKITGRENLVRSLPKSCQIKAPTFTFSSSGRKWDRQALDGLLPRTTVKAREPLNDGYRYWFANLPSMKNGTASSKSISERLDYLLSCILPTSKALSGEDGGLFT